ncbi:MAG: DUF1810 domain-containing protein [Paludibacter sp.]|nr:DUF1810 domain-containing protein [Paludibacter sp.]
MINTDPYFLQRFVEAQNRNYDTALQELRNGRKISHWMWWIFPQLKELGLSANSKFYGISGRDEARYYLLHPVLRERLETCVKAVLVCGVQHPVTIFGHTDSLKFQSCLTLFSLSEPDNKLFIEALSVFFSRD